MKINDEVLTILSTALRIEENRVQITEQLDRKTYQRVNDVLMACGGTWNRKARAHVFVMVDPTAAIEQVLATGEVTHARVDLAFFPTPAPLAAEIVERAGVQIGDTVLEPSAGTGRLVEAALAIPTVEVHMVERDPTMRAELGRRHRWTSQRDDFMDYGEGPGGPIASYDRVIMNPPFMKVGQGDHLDHTRHAFRLLRPGGVLVAILPGGVEFRADRRHRDFRDWMGQRGGTMERLPEGAFKASGTGVRTVVVRMEAAS